MVVQLQVRKYKTHTILKGAFIAKRFSVDANCSAIGMKTILSDRTHGCGGKNWTFSSWRQFMMATSYQAGLLRNNTDIFTESWRKKIRSVEIIVIPIERRYVIYYDLRSVPCNNARAQAQSSLLHDWLDPGQAGRRPIAFLWHADKRRIKNTNKTDSTHTHTRVRIIYAHINVTQAHR